MATQLHPDRYTQLRGTEVGSLAEEAFKALSCAFHEIQVLFPRRKVVIPERTVEEVVDHGPKLSEEDIQQARKLWSKPLKQINRTVPRPHQRSTTNASTSTNTVVVDLDDDDGEAGEELGAGVPDENAPPAKKPRRPCLKRGRSFPAKRKGQAWSRRRKESSKTRSVSDLRPSPPVDFDPKKLVQKSLRGFLASD